MAATFFVFETGVEGVPVDFFLNDIPVSFLDPVKSPREAQPVNQYLVDGKNELKMLVKGGQVSREGFSGGEGSEAGAPMSCYCRLTRYPQGVFPGDPAGVELATIRWPIDKIFTKVVDLGPMFGEWAWQKAPALTLDSATVRAVETLLYRLAETIGKGDAETYLRLAHVKFTENARAYGLDVGKRISEWREDLAEMAREQEWRVLPVDPATFALRLCARNRMIDCLDQSGLPILCANPDDEGIPAVRYPMKLAQVNGQLQIVR